MATSRSFRSKPLNALNLENEQFNSKVLELAFKSPESFFWLRRTLMKNLLEDTVTEMYQKIFNLLTMGSTNDDGSGEFIALGSAGGATSAALTGVFGAFSTDRDSGFRPKMSEQKADELALDLVAGLQELLRDKIVDVLLPKSIFAGSLERSGKAAALQISGGGGGP